MSVSTRLTAAFTGHKSQSGCRAGQPVINLGAALYCFVIRPSYTGFVVQSVLITIHVEVTKIPPLSLFTFVIPKGWVPIVLPDELEATGIVKRDG